MQITYSATKGHQKVKDVGLHQLEVSEPALYSDTIEIHTMERDSQALVPLAVKSAYKAATLTCKADTGAERNVMPLATFKSLVPADAFDQDGNPCCLKPSSTNIVAYGDSAINMFGTYELSLTRNGREEIAVFYIVQSQGPVIIGLPTCRSLGLVTLNYSITNVAETADRKPYSAWRHKNKRENTV